MSYQLPIAATLFLRCVSGALVEDRQKPTPKPYGHVSAISLKNPECRSRALGLNKRIPGIRYKSLAAILGKSIVFHSIDLSSRKGLRAEWRIGREICFGLWGTCLRRNSSNFWQAKCWDRFLVKPYNLLFYNYQIYISQAVDVLAIASHLY